MILVSAMETTTVAPVGSMRRAGCVNRVAGVLFQLHEDMASECPVEAPRTPPCVY